MDREAWQCLTGFQSDRKEDQRTLCMVWKRQVCVSDEDRDLKIFLGWEKCGQEMAHSVYQALARMWLSVNMC